MVANFGYRYKTQDDRDLLHWMLRRSNNTIWFDFGKEELLHQLQTTGAKVIFWNLNGGFVEQSIDYFLGLHVLNEQIN